MPNRHLLGWSSVWRRCAGALIALSMLAAASSVGPSALTASAAPTGSTPWAIVLCKFADQTSEPQSRAWLNAFFTQSGAGTGGIYDYWSQASGGQIDLN